MENTEVVGAAPEQVINTTAVITEETVDVYPTVTEKEAGLALIPRKTIEQYFTKGGMDSVILAIEEKVTEFAPNMTTPKGRAEIKSFAAKVTKSKTYIEGIGKEFVAEAKAEIKKVDAVRKDTRERLEDLAIKARAPLTAWEGKEKARVEEMVTKVEEIVLHGTLTDEATGLPKPLSTLRVSLKYLENMVIDGTWSEFEEDATTKSTMAKMRLKGQITQFEELEALQAKQAEAEEKRLFEEKQAHEKHIADTAAAAAKEQAEQKARADKEAADNRAAEEARKAKEAEQRAKDAEARARQAEIDAANQAEATLKAQQKAEADNKLKIRQAEIAATNKAKLEATAKAQKEQDEANARAADVEHRGKINREILAAYVECGIEESHAKNIIKATINGRIPHVKVVY